MMKENMDAIHEPGAPPVTMTEEERGKVREQLNRLLETHHFKNSKRYPPLLRFIVEETLEGRGEFLKERLLGVRVFDRPADYDTATDPIVRVTIAEIRKRIAQYYHDEEHDSEIRIELLPGRYAPEFRTRHGTVPGRSPSAAEMAELSRMGVPAAPAPRADRPAAILAAGGRPRSLRWYRVALVSLIAALIALTAMPVMHWLQPPALTVFWAPLLNSPKSILFCVPTDVGKKRGPAGASDTGDPNSAERRIKTSSPQGPTFLEFESLGENVVYSDMLAALRIGNVLAVNHHDYHAKLNVYSTLEDLRQGPAVLIGGLDNQWSMRALGPLRYHFAGSDEDRYWIADAQDPNNKRWSLDLKVQWGAVTRDYAIVARLHNEETGQPEMIVAGIGMSGTAAAGEFITDERSMKELRQRLGAGFKDRDFEAVLSTDVVNGIAGTPRILAFSTW
jgi:hypothetical protein